MGNRRLCCVLTLGAGAILAALGLALSAPLGQPDPRLAFAPVLFVSGLGLMFATAVVYELAGSD